MAKLLQVGVIGIGGIAHTHFPGWRESPYSEIAGIADISSANLKRIGDGLAVERRYEDPYALISDKSIDVIDICTPNAFHTPLTVAALEAGKHVICEKPLALTPSEVRQMIAACDKSGKLLMTAQSQRFLVASIALKEAIDTGVLGDVYHARAWMLRRAFAGITPTFIYKNQAGGGALIDIGVHILDLALWLMGNPRPVSVSGITQDRLSHKPGAFSVLGPIPPDTEVDEFGAGFVRFEGGRSLILETSWMLNHDTGGQLEDTQLWLYGEDGGARWPSDEIFWADAKSKELRSTALPVLWGAEPHALECMAFAEAIALGRPSPVPPEQTLSVVAIIDGIYRSNASGKEVFLEKELI
jgi:predicted dehydrogenase